MDKYLITVMRAWITNSVEGNIPAWLFFSERLRRTGIPVTIIV